MNIRGFKTIYITLLALLAGIFCFQACQNSAELQTAQFAVNGQKIYVNNCQNCHGSKGEGLGKLYPPLTDQKFLRDNKEKLACIVKFGSKKALTVNGQKYTGEMPANMHLTDVDIAYVLTYITTKFGSMQGYISQDEITKDLKNCQQ